MFERGQSRTNVILTALGSLALCRESSGGAFHKTNLSTDTSASTQKETEMDLCVRTGQALVRVNGDPDRIKTDAHICASIILMPIAVYGFIKRQQKTQTNFK